MYSLGLYPPLVVFKVFLEVFGCELEADVLCHALNGILQAGFLKLSLQAKFQAEANTPSSPCWWCQRFAYIVKCLGKWILQIKRNRIFYAHCGAEPCSKVHGSPIMWRFSYHIQSQSRCCFPYSCSCCICLDALCCFHCFFGLDICRPDHFLDHCLDHCCWYYPGLCLGHC
jgi:hypothetical protein